MLEKFREELASIWWTMNETIRRPDQVSPKSSPRGSRSPAYPRTDSTGTLKTTISLGRGIPSVIHSGPFYLVKDTGPAHESEITGSKNLMMHYGLHNSYLKFCKKEGKEELSSFLPSLPGYIDAPGEQDNSSLRSLIENPPKTVKELNPLSGPSLQGFKLHPGPILEQYRFMSQMPKKKQKHKKRKDDKPNTLQEDNSPDVKPKKAKTEDPPKKQKKKKKKKRAREKEDGDPYNITACHNPTNPAWIEEKCVSKVHRSNISSSAHLALSKSKVRVMDKT